MGLFTEQIQLAATSGGADEPRPWKSCRAGGSLLTLTTPFLATSRPGTDRASCVRYGQETAKTQYCTRRNQNVDVNENKDVSKTVTQRSCESPRERCVLLQ
jgi:hypothetical protein